MSQILAVTALILLIIAALGGALDFLLSQDAHRKIKDRLKDWYVAVTEGDWHLLVASASEVTEGLIARYFGRRAFSWRYGVFAFVINAAVLLITLYPFMWNAVKDYAAPMTLVFLALLNATVDVISLGLSRRVLRTVALGREGLGLARCLFSLFFVAYFSCALVVLVEAVLYQVGSSSGLLPYGTIFLLWPALFFVLKGPFIQKFVFLLPALSALLFLLILLATTLVVLMRPVIRGPLSTVLDRLSEAPNGAIATSSGAIAIIVGLIAAAKDVFTK